MRIGRCIFVFTLILSFRAFAADVYIDSTLPDDCSTGNYSVENRNCTGSDGVAYNTLKEAIWGTDGTDFKISIGDVVILRGGTYTEAWGNNDGSSSTSGAAMQFPSGLNGSYGPGWTTGTYTTIESYPGEWAILQGSAGYDSVIGYVTASSGTGEERRGWKLERLEVTGGAYSGVGVNRGPFWIRLCYIHNNGKDESYDENLSGVNLRRSSYSIIEYNYFSNNGQTTTNNPAHILNTADYLYTSGTFDLSVANHSNIIRYNHFTGSVSNGIHDKAAQYLASYVDTSSNVGPGSIDDLSNQALGNKYHHNIFEDVTGDAIYMGQFFEQVYNNIIDGSELTTHVNSSTRPIFGLSVYNNTVIDASVEIALGYGRREIATDIRYYCLNNIIDSAPTTFERAAMSIATSHSSTLNGPCALSDWSWSNVYIDNNFIYNPTSTTEHFSLPNSRGGNTSCKDSRWITTAEFNTQRGTTNYTNSTPGLYLGTTGADKYVTVGSFVVDGIATIASGGVGGNHPYLSGVTLPSYIGATNPNDHAWVAGVLAMDAAWFKNQTDGSTPSWVEGVGSGSEPSGHLESGTLEIETGTGGFE